MSRPLDVEVSGWFSAAELRVRERRRGETRVTGDGDVEIADEAVRENVPEDSVEGQTYRDVHVGRRVGARLRAGEPDDG